MKTLRHLALLCSVSCSLSLSLAAHASCMDKENQAQAPLAPLPNALKQATKNQNISLEVSKMHCGACELKVRKKIREFSESKEIKVSRDEKLAQFTCSKDICDLKTLVQELGTAGYPSRVL